jgi:hypothetical protein
MTRRRTLAIALAAALTSLLARGPSISFARAGHARSFSIKGRLGEILKAPQRFDLVGLRGSGLETANLEIRTRALRGSWTKWMPIHAGGDHRPDGGTGKHASDPIWVDGARELELRGSGRVPHDLRVQFVAVSALARRAGARSVARASSKRSFRQASGLPVIISRAQWGAAASRGNPGLGEVQMAFVHHTVTANEYAPQDTPAILQSIQKYHQDSNGWLDIGYNFLVDKYGVLYEGRAGGIDQPVIGAQAQGWNDDSTGISNIGTFTSVAQTPAAIESLSRLIAWKLSIHGAPVAGKVSLVSGGGSENKYASGTVVSFNRISGHRDGGKTSCPGDALYAQMGQIRTRAAEIAPEFANITGRLTMIRSASAVKYGDPLTLSGKLRRLDYSPVIAGAVLVQKRGKKSWVTIAKTVTGADGSYSATIPWRASGRVRVRADVDGGQAVSSAAEVDCIPLLSMSKKARVGKSSAVKGKVKPAETFKVMIERKSGSKYRKVGTYSIKTKRNAFKAKLPLRKAGRYKITPVVKNGKKVFKGKSVLLRAVH